LKIVFVYRDFFHDGGVPYEVRSLVEAIVKQGIKVAVLYKKDNQKKYEKYWSEKGVELVEINNPIGEKNKVVDFLRIFKPNLAHFFSLWIPFHNILSQYFVKLNIPYIISLHGTLNPYMLVKRFGGKGNDSLYKYLKKGYRFFFDTPFLKKAAALHALSEYEYKLASKINNKFIFIAPNGIDSEWLIQKRNNITAINKKVFLYLGRLDVFQKGLDLVLEAFEEISKSSIFNEAYKLVIAGPNVSNAHKYLYSKSKNIDNIFFLGPVYGHNKEKLWNEATYFLHLSRFEGMARAAREAIAHGIPIIASRESNFGDWVYKYKIGYTVELNKNSLLRALYEIFEEKNAFRYNELQNNALFFAKEYTWDKVGEIVAKNYKNVLL